MRTHPAGLAALLLLGAATSEASPITYSVDTTITSANPTGNPLQTNTVLGSITTDGTIGVLGVSNFVGWSLSLVDHLNAANNYVLTTANSSVVLVTGSALTASPTELFFDYSGSGEFLIQADSPGAFSGYRYFCFSTGVFACLAGETISPDNIFTSGVVRTGTEAPIGVQPLDQTPSPTAVPEPASLTLVGLGLAAAAARLRNRTRKVAR